MSTSKPAFLTTLQEALLKHLRGPRSSVQVLAREGGIARNEVSLVPLAARAGLKIRARTIT